MDHPLAANSGMSQHDRWQRRGDEQEHDGRQDGDRRHQHRRPPLDGVLVHLLSPGIAQISAQREQPLAEIHAALERCGLFLSIGTSGEVYPAAGFVLHVRRQRPRARTVELNLEPSGNQTLFREHQYGPATQVVPAFVARVLREGLTV